MMKGEPRRAAITIGLAFVLLVAGCTVKPPATSATPPTAPAATPSVTSAAPEGATTSTAPQGSTDGGAPASAQSPMIMKPAVPLIPEVVAPPTDSSAPPAKATRPVAPNSRAATPAKTEPAPPPKKEPAAPEAAKKPTLDLASLEQRLKDTPAIGVLTKISLKNQVDDLLDQFRAYYQGKLKTTLAELRRPYDLLVMKVLALLQDSDPSLASAIVASREAIWGILADPKRFATVA